MRLGLRAVAKTEIMSASGQSVRLVVRLGSLAAGTAERQGILASVFTEADLRAVGTGIDGVLGQDFLAAFDYTLDYQRLQLTWDEEQVLAGSAARLPMSPDGGRFVVTLPQGAGRGVRIREGTRELARPNRHARVATVAKWRSRDFPKHHERGGHPLDS